MMKRAACRSLFALAACLLLSGCDSAELDASRPPAVVTPEAFAVETFEPSAAKSAAGENLTAAALRYVPVSVTLGLKYLLVPKLVTLAAVEAEPEIRDGAWVWSADVETPVGPMSYTLIGRPDDDDVSWRMEISGTNAYTGDVERFTLYTAETNADATTGRWELFYKIDGERVHVLDAEFDVEHPTKKQITFSVPARAPEYAGYEVRYERDGALRTFYWRQPQEGEEHTLTWNPDAGIGSIRSTNFRDGNTYCWDAGGDDTSCPETMPT